MPEQKHKAQIKPGLYLSLDERRGSRQKIRCEEWVKGIERQAFTGKADAPTFKAAVVRWESEYLPTGVKPQVARRYLTSVVSLAKLMGDVPVDKIDGKLISRYVTSRKGAVSNATIRRDLTALSSVLAACAAWDLVHDGNAAAIFDRKIVKERRGLIEIVRQDSVDAMLTELPPPMAVLLRLLDQTGMRLNEVVSLERWQVDYGKGQIFLNQTKTSRPRVISFSSPGGDCAELLAPFEAQNKGHLFVNRDGEPYGNYSSNFGQVARRLQALAGKSKGTFVRFRVHDMRHMFAIRWLQSGGDRSCPTPWCRSCG